VSKETITSVLKVRGTAADRTAFKITDIPAYQEIEFTETDTNNVYVGSQDGWGQSKRAGATIIDTKAPTPLPTATLTALAATWVAAGTQADHVDEEYFDTDLGYKVKFDGVSAFVPSQKTTDGAAHVSIRSDQTHPIDRMLEYSQSAVAPADNQAVWTSGDLTGYSVHSFYVTAGSISVQADLHGSGVWSSDLTGRNISSTTPGTFVATMTAFGIIQIVGNYKKLRVLSNGVANITCISTHTNGNNHG